VYWSQEELIFYTEDTVVYLNGDENGSIEGKIVVEGER
jgi:hypothetical protein